MKHNSSSSEIVMRRFNCRLWYFGLAVSFVLFFSYFTWFNRPAISPTNLQPLTSKVYYAVIFDAGSTGSRVHVFNFTKKDNSYQLLGDMYAFTSPGLSAYAKNPKEAADSLLPLLQKAKRTVPPYAWPSTPVLLKATAGLRLLPKSEGDGIIGSVSLLLKRSPFKVSQLGPLAEVMDGVDEAVFSWFAVNFLTGNLVDKDKIPSRNVVALDLGGGSTQITFAPELKSTLTSSPASFLLQFQPLSRILGSKTKLYTHSYLGLGLKAARMTMLKKANLSTPCVPDGKNLSWKYSGVKYQIKGLESHSYINCGVSAKSLIDDKLVHHPSEIKKKEVFVFSYFFDRAQEVNLVKTPDRDPAIKIGQLEQAASKICASHTSKEDFLCADLTFISQLLTYGYGLALEDKIFIRKRIKGVEISWALGLAYSLLP